MTRPMPVLNMKGGCLGELGSLAGGFLKGQSGDSQVLEFWQCLDVTVHKFSQVTRGAEPGLYRADEIRQFLQTYFFPRQILTDQIFAEFMALKPLLVGGAPDYVTVAELEKLRHLIKELSEISLALRPHIARMAQWKMAAIRDGALPEIPAEEGNLESLYRAILEAAEQIGGLLGQSRMAYSMERLDALIFELDRIRGSQWVRWVPLVSGLKQLAVGGRERLILAEDWQPLLSLLAKAFHIKFIGELVVQSDSVTDPQTLKFVDKVFQGGFQLAEEVVSSQFEQRLAWPQIEKLVQELDELEVLPLSLNADEFRQLLQVLLDRFLSPVRCEQVGSAHKKKESPSQWSSPGLSLEHLAQLRTLYEDWFLGQSSISHLLKGASEEIVHPRLFQLASGPAPLVHDSLGRLMLWSDPSVPGRFLSYSASDLTQLNLLGFLVEELVKAYAPAVCMSDGSLEQTLGLQQEHLEQVVIELYPLLSGLGLVSFAADDQESLRRFVGKVFRDAGLFMPRSDGDRWVDLFEAVEFLTFALSGLKASRFVFSELAPVEHCLQQDSANEVLGLDPVTCLRPLLFGKRDRLLSHLPQLRAYLDGQDVTQWMLFERELELTVRKSGYSSQPVSVAELTEMMVMMKYIEAFFFRFDGNADRKINLAESLDAFPVFLPTLMELFEAIGVDTDEELVRAFFTFLFREGSTPFDDVEGFEEWMAHPELWSVNADRLVLAKILASLSELGASSIQGGSSRGF